MALLGLEEDLHSLGEKTTIMRPHWVELRQRLIVCFVGVFCITLLSYNWSDVIFQWLVAPLSRVLSNKEGPRQLIYTGVSEAFFTYVKVSLFSGMVIGFPFCAFQLWRFVAPGLYFEEKKLFAFLLIGALLLFIIGVWFSYGVILPMAFEFFVSFESSSPGGELSLHMEPRVGEYLDFVMRLFLAFGISFQLPIFLSGGALLGWIDSGMLRKHWRVAVVGIFFISAILTPPDLMSMIGLAIPLVGLYCLSIGAVHGIECLRKARPHA